MSPMSAGSLALHSSPAHSLFRIKSFHVAEKLRLKDLRERFTRQPTEFSNYELIVRYTDDSYMFVYNYGSVVFLNVPDDVQERELKAIADSRTPSELSSSSSVNGPTTDVFLLEVHPNHQGPGVTSNKVYFDRVVVSNFSHEAVKIVCMLVAESTALEYYEVLIQNLLEKTNTYSKKLQKQGRMLTGTEDLIKFIGLCLDIKQEIISNLYIVDSPDETWENVELDRLHQDLKLMMEIDTRYRALEYKIKIIQESIDVIVDLSKSKREVQLEVVIILLISFEIVLSIIKWKSW